MTQQGQISAHYVEPRYEGKIRGKLIYCTDPLLRNYVVVH